MWEDESGRTTERAESGADRTSMTDYAAETAPPPEQVFEESLYHLELPEVLEEVAAHAGSLPGRFEVLRTAPAWDRETIVRRLRTVVQMGEIIQLNGTIGFADLAPLEGLLEKLENPSAILEAEEIIVLRDMLGIVQRTHDRLEGLDERYDLLRETAGRFRRIEPIRFKIDEVIDDQGVIRSTASARLAKIRDKTASLRRRIYRNLEEVVNAGELARVVQEDYVTMRNDRYVILLRPEFKGLMDGIVHDHSRSGASVYVEPLRVVELNNEVASTLDEEREEVLRIYRELTDEIRFVREDIAHDYRLLAVLDADQARALYAAHTDAIEPELSDEGFSILGARHPLLIAAEDTAVVPMDIRQDDAGAVTIISGANMGGKTVALKIAGLFPLMARCGIMLPAREGTKIRPFSRIMADIGEEQDIRGRVSSFSGRLARLKSILETAEAGDLVALDELGGSTDPEEGAALAMAVMDDLLERGARVVVTTHLTQLKAYALGRDRVRNVSVEFHPQTLEPTYRLLYDLPGESHAIRTAERIGLPERVIDAARAYVDKSVGGSSQLLENLRAKLEEVERLTVDLERRKRELEQRDEQMRVEGERLAEEFRKEARDLIKRGQKEVADLQRSMKKGRSKEKRAPLDVISALREDMERMLGLPLECRVSEIPVGSRVRVKTLGKTGEVLSVRESGRAEVAVGPMRITTDREDLELLDRPTKKSSSKNERVKVDIPRTMPRGEVNVIGLRVDDAIPIVDKALDDAVMGGLSEISVIHGKGTGRLKEAVWDYLSGNPLAKDVRHSDAEGGGAGVTVVRLDSE